MRFTRRSFLQHASWLTATVATRGHASHDMHSPPGASGVRLLDTSVLARYVDPLPIPTVLKRSGLRPSPVGSTHIPYYRVPMRQFQGRVHRDVPPTTLWGYAGAFPGPTFEVRREQPVL